MTGPEIKKDCIQVNGQWRDWPQNADDDNGLTRLLSEFDIAPGARGVAIAVNGAVVPSRRWADTVLSAGDVVEIVRPLQGG